MKRILGILLCAVLMLCPFSAAFAADNSLCAVTLKDEENVREYVTYIPNDGSGSDAPAYSTLTCYGKAFAGWCETPDGEIVLSSLENAGDYFEGRENAVLYAKWITPTLASDEVYSFSNSDYYFDVDKGDEQSGKYYIADGEHSMMVSRLYKTFGISPVSVIGSVVYSFYPEWDFRGSCYGMSATAALQHYGMLDMLRYGENVEKLIDLDPTKELISAINYYQYSAMVSFLCESKYYKGLSTAPVLLKDMVASVESGNIVQFTYYDDMLLFSSGHTVLLTGAYTDENGNHVLILYDNRYPNDYQVNFTSRIVISEDYSDIRFFARGGREEPVASFNWLDDFTVFNTVDINGNGNSLTWYKTLFKHILVVFGRLIGK